MSQDYSEWEEIPAKDLWLNDEKRFVWRKISRRCI